MLDQSGGELLLGQGDMLMLKPTGAGLVRAQGAFVDDKEIKNISRFLKEIAEPEFHPELMQLGAAQGLAEGEEKDPLYNEAVDAENLRMVWGVSNVNSWYKNARGRVAQNWPYPLIEYWKRTHAVNPADYDVL